MDAEALSVLREIRDEARQTNVRLGAVETTLVELAEQQRFVVRYLKTLSERDGRMEADVVDLQRRVEALERQGG